MSRLSFAAFALMFASFACIASDDTVSILKFYNFSERGHAAALRMIDAAHIEDPDEAEVLKGSLALYNSDEETRRVGLIFDTLLGKDDIQNFKSFARSAAGVLMSQIFHETKTAAEAAVAINRLPQKDVHEMNTFFATKAGQDVNAAFDSPEVQHFAQEYPQELICRYVKQNRKDLLENLKRAGKCST